MNAISQHSGIMDDFNLIEMNIPTAGHVLIHIYYIYNLHVSSPHIVAHSKSCLVPMAVPKWTRVSFCRIPVH